MSFQMGRITADRYRARLPTQNRSHVPSAGFTASAWKSLTMITQTERWPLDTNPWRSRTCPHIRLCVKTKNV